MAFVRRARDAVSTARIPIEAKTASKVAVYLASRSRIRWVKRCPVSLPYAEPTP
jgi:hypothetical protein